MKPSPAQELHMPDDQLYPATLCTNCNHITVRASFCRSCGKPLAETGINVEVCAHIKEGLDNCCTAPHDEWAAAGHQIRIT
jgi:hypothetical protein